jgi:APA family basic amino acid/polyamine antiporter
MLATLLLLIFSQFEKQFDLAIFAEWIFYLLIATTIFVYRRKRPDLARPYKVWGYPVLPAIFCLGAVPVLVYSFMENQIGSLIGAALILLGLPVLWLVRRQYGASVPIDESHGG